MNTLGDSFERVHHSHLGDPAAASLNQVAVPDIWQQQAVAALRDGQDVVVHAPTGAGKTLVFELWSNHGKNRGQAIYTVPTRALANDKLAEWRARGWTVGIATGDLAENLEAPVIVATLETQKNRLIRGDGPTLLVVDEYQMIGDADRGLNYELAIALAPPQTQLLLLSGSVANPDHIVKWLTRLGRRAVLVRHEERPVPLEEIDGNSLNYFVPSEIKGYWPRFVAKALAENLGPVLVFAPQRRATEALASELARYLPNPNPLQLTAEQKQVVGEKMARMLKSRVTFHHSGLSYTTRAGVIEPLAKAGQLRVVVATMGLAAGINFSLRSVVLAGDSYRRDNVEHAIKADEILQMFGRAGRRGLDECGYVLVSQNGLRLADGRPAWLSRSGMIDWNALLGLMHAASVQGRRPFEEAVRVQQRLYTTKPIILGVEESLKHPDVPCGLQTDAERARYVRTMVREIFNSRGEWERLGQMKPVPVKDVKLIREDVMGQSPGQGTGPTTPASTDVGRVPSPGDDAPVLIPALTSTKAIEKVGQGLIVVVGESDGRPLFGRSSTVADRLADGRLVLAKWVRRATHWQRRELEQKDWEQTVLPALQAHLAAQHTPVVRVVEEEMRLMVHLDVGELPLRVAIDRHGVALWRPPERETVSANCARCSLVETCMGLPAASGVALLWRRLGLVNAGGVPTRRGQVVSFFHQGDGLALAAALEDEKYPLEELVYDLANLDAGFRFSGGDARFDGRLAYACRRLFSSQTIPGYLEDGIPPSYGFGAEEVVRSVHRNPEAKHAFVTEWTGPGDIDRVIIEWRSTLRQVVHSPALEWPRWNELKALAKTILNETESPTLTDLPKLEFSQTRRTDHKLNFRRH